MRLSSLLTKTVKTVPQDAESVNARLLLKGGFVRQEMAGVYSWLPLGLRVLRKVEAIVREEMNAVGGQEVLMPALQPKEYWETTERWNTVDILFKVPSQTGKEYALGCSHEEVVTPLVQSFAQSYKDFPVSVYQIQTKFRDELRAKSGVLRGREFVMKDMYSLHVSKEDMDVYYDKVIAAYKRCYDRLGLGDSTFVTFASGGAFTKFSHEFQTICDAGEDILYVNDDRTVAVNEEVLEDAARELGIEKDALKPVKSAEVGNIFKFGTEKSEQMKIYFTDSDGVQKPIYLASYGIGITRVMGVIVEKFADDKGIVWPSEIAPFKFHLVSLATDAETIEKANDVYESLVNSGAEVLYDDRPDVRAGEKFADSDLLGLPWRLVISTKSLAAGGVEVKNRTTGETQIIALTDLLAWTKSI